MVNHLQTQKLRRQLLPPFYHLQGLLWLYYSGQFFTISYNLLFFSNDDIFIFFFGVNHLDCLSLFSIAKEGLKGGRPWVQLSCDLIKAKGFLLLRQARRLEVIFDASKHRIDFREANDGLLVVEGLVLIEIVPLRSASKLSAHLSEVVDAIDALCVALDSVNDAADGQIEEIEGPRQTRLEGPDTEGLLVVDAEALAKVSGDAVLHAEVLLELVVVLNHFVSAPLQCVDKRARALALERVALCVSQEVRAVLARAERALQRAAVAHLEPIETLVQDKDKRVLVVII